MPVKIQDLCLSPSLTHSCTEMMEEVLTHTACDQLKFCLLDLAVYTDDLSENVSHIKHKTLWSIVNNSAFFYFHDLKISLSKR